MSVLDDQVGADVQRLAHDAVVKWVVAPCIDFHGEVLGAQRLRELLEATSVPLDEVRRRLVASRAGA